MKNNKTAKNKSKKTVLAKKSKKKIEKTKSILEPRKRYQFKGFFYGWTIFIMLFFIFMFFSDDLLFVLLYPGWSITLLIRTPDLSVPFFGSVLLSLLIISSIFYCLLGIIIGFLINKIKYGTFFDKTRDNLFKKLWKKVTSLKIPEKISKNNKPVKKIKKAPRSKNKQ